MDGDRTPEVVGIGVGGSDHADDARVSAAPHLPDVQVADPGRDVALFDRLADLGHHRRVHLRVEQDPPGIAQQAPGPDRDQRRADQAHYRIQPGRAHEHAAEQGQDRQHRGRRVGHHVQVGRAQVEVVAVGMPVSVVPVVAVVVVVPVAVPMLVAQPPGAEQVHRQAHRGDCDRLLVVDRAGLQQPLHGLRHHQRGHAQQQDRAGVAAEDLDLPGAEGEAAVAGVAPRAGIGERRQT